MRFLPLLITGIAGVAGYNAFQYFSSRYPGQVFGARRADNWPLSGPGILDCDTDDEQRWYELFERYQFAAVLNCEGSCKLKSCELDPEMAWRVNVIGLENLLAATRGARVRLVHLSVDLVFSGHRAGDYREDDMPDPVTIYGKTMVAAERRLLEQRPDACMLRISLPMGVSFNGHAGAIDWIQSRFAKSKPATLYYDEVRSPTYTDCLNHLFERVLASDLSGLYHAGGPRRLSLYQIAQIVNRIGGYDPRLLIGCLRAEAGPIPPRAGDVSMNSDKLRQALGYDPFDPWPLHDEFAPTGPAWHFERDDRVGPELLEQVLYNNTRRRMSPP
jgi:dTDP-4-dehydrorhamnose reductase